MKREVMSSRGDMSGSMDLDQLKFNMLSTVHALRGQNGSEVKCSTGATVTTHIRGARGWEYRAGAKRNWK